MNRMNRLDRQELAGMIRREIETALEAWFGPRPGTAPTVRPSLEPMATPPNGVSPEEWANIQRMVDERIDHDAIAKHRSRRKKR